MAAICYQYTVGKCYWRRVNTPNLIYDTADQSYSKSELMIGGSKQNASAMLAIGRNWLTSHANYIDIVIIIYVL